MKRSTQEIQDVRSIMGPVNPAQPESLVGKWREESAQQALARIIASPETGAGLLAPNNEFPRVPLVRRRSLTAMGVLAVCSALAVTVATLHGAGRTGPALRATPTSLHYEMAGQTIPVTAKNLPGAQPTLLRLASLAEKQAPPSKSNLATVSYVRTRAWNLNVAVSGGNATSNLVTTDREQWIAPDRQIHYVERTAGESDSNYTGTDDAQVMAATLPTSSGELRTRLLAGGPPADKNIPDTFVLMDSIEQLHGQAISPELEGAFWRVLAGQSELKEMGAVVDRADRSGTAVAYDFNIGLPTRLIFIISPETGRLLDVEHILTSDPGKLRVTIPAVTSYTVYLKYGWVSKLADPI